MDDKLIDINAVAEYLNVSKAKAYNLTNSGELVGYKVGDALRYKPSDVEDYLNRNRVVAKRD